MFSVLVFTAVDAEKRRHGVTPLAEEAIRRLGQAEGFRVDVSDDPSRFNASGLGEYDAVVLLNARGTVLDEDQRGAFREYVRDGGGAAIIHAAMLFEEEWDWFTGLAGARFDDHPNIQPGRLEVVEFAHAANRDLPQTWSHTDEWYNFESLPGDVTVLITVDEASYTGGKHGDDHPVAWCHEFGGGRSFYTALGHTEESWSNPVYLNHVLGGIKYAAGVE